MPRVSVGLPAPTIEKLNKKAKQKGIRMSEYLRHVLIALADHESGPYYEL